MALLNQPPAQFRDVPTNSRETRFDNQENL